MTTICNKPEPIPVDVIPRRKSIKPAIPEHPIIITNPYEGEYEVTPQAEEEIVLPTKNKTLIEDVTVKKIPYFETSNLYGETIYIASEVN